MRRGGLTFWLLPEEEQDFFAYLNSTGKIVAYRNAWFASPKDVRGSTLELMAAGDPKQILIGCADHAAGIVVEQHDFPGEGVHYAVTAMGSSVLQYSRGQLEGRRLGQSHIGTYWDFIREGGQLVTPKGESFVAWAKRAFSWLRKRTPERHIHRSYPYRASKQAKAAAEAGKLDLVLY